MSVCIRAVSTRMPRMTRARSAGRSFAPRSKSSAYADTARHRRAQLVGRVGDELAELLLGRGAARERVLDVARASC